MFKVTPAAAQQVFDAARQGGTEGMALRLAAQQLDDGSIDYRMGFDESREDDIKFATEGVTIVMEPEYVPLLDKAVMDYVETEQGEYNFIFLNPMDKTYQPPTEAGAIIPENTAN